MGRTRGGEQGRRVGGGATHYFSTYLDVIFVVSWYGEEAVTYLYGGVSGGHEASDLGHDYGAPDLTKERALGAVRGETHRGTGGETKRRRRREERRQRRGKTLRGFDSHLR